MKIALHICCGVCAAGVVERLTAEGHVVHGYFYNPNIYPEEEYHKRLSETIKVSRLMNFHLEVGPYSWQHWQKEVSSFVNEPEGGLRCEICFRIRLQKTYQYMRDIGTDVFSTTLTVSPHKSARVINIIGKEIGSESYLERDYKKRDGFKRAMELAREWNLYRQRYCGCIYSMRE